MSLILKESICSTCKWTTSCMIFKKISGITDNRKFEPNTNHEKDIIEIVVKTCSLQNYDRSYKSENRR